MKKNDILLVAAVLLAAAAVFLWFRSRGADFNGNALTITVDGEEFGTFSLFEEREIEIGEGNTCRISGGRASMVWANCPDSICVHSKAIGAGGGTIICMPNRVILTITASGEDAIDTVAG